MVLTCDSCGYAEKDETSTFCQACGSNLKKASSFVTPQHQSFEDGKKSVTFVTNEHQINKHVVKRKDNSNKILLSFLVENLDVQSQLLLPTSILLVVCVATIIFSTLSTRPKVTKDGLTKEDIEQRRGNLLFFGNFFDR